MITLNLLDFYYASPKDDHEYSSLVNGIAIDKDGKVLWVDDATNGDSIRVGSWCERELSYFHENWEWFKVGKYGMGSYSLPHRPKRLRGQIYVEPLRCND